jgi:hypothetical protein
MARQLGLEESLVSFAKGIVTVQPTVATFVSETGSEAVRTHSECRFCGR